MTNTEHNSTMHRLAAVTTLVALLPIVVGALVTTLQAGMAFLDWPTSDGHNMLTYDWLRDLREGRIKKAVEHGHRLAGIVIGCFGLVLTFVAWRTPNRPAVRWLATASLAGIVCQGLLGGARVVQDERLLAMLHGQFAAVVFSLLAVTWLVSSPSWSRVGCAHLTHASDSGPADRWAQPTLLALAFLTTVVVLIQYVLGGLLRHQGTALVEHMGLAVLALGLVIAASIKALLSGERWLRSSGWAMLVVVLAQVALGGATFITKYGLRSTGYVAVRGTPLQLLVASAHTVVGMVLVATCVVFTVKVSRLAFLARTTEPDFHPAPDAASLTGGVA